MVVILYWRLYFADPTSVTRDGQLGNFWLEMYLHALGPALQWIDATFIHRSFNRMKRTLPALFGVIALYVVWVELIVAPMNDSPMGSVTSGLPYPFLNDLDLLGRATFYGVNFGVAVVVLFGFAAVAAVMRKVIRPSATP